MKKVIPLGILASLAMPFLALAAGTPIFGQSDTLGNVIAKIGGLIAQATPVVVALALLGFFWGLAIYIFNQSNEKKKGEGRNIMIWGILALFIMLSVFGIISVLQSTFNVGNDQIQNNNIPSISSSASSNTYTY